MEWHYHVVPHVEFHEHDIDGYCTCSCEPEPKFLDDDGVPYEDGRVIMVHNRFRGLDQDTKWDLVSPAGAANG